MITVAFIAAAAAARFKSFFVSGFSVTAAAAAAVAAAAAAAAAATAAADVVFVVVVVCARFISLFVRGYKFGAPADDNVEVDNDDDTIDKYNDAAAAAASSLSAAESSSIRRRRFSPVNAALGENVFACYSVCVLRTKTEKTHAYEIHAKTVKLTRRGQRKENTNKRITLKINMATIESIKGDKKNKQTKNIRSAPATNVTLSAT
jgi:hypothetical protein